RSEGSRGGSEQRGERSEGSRGGSEQRGERSEGSRGDRGPRNRRPNHHDRERSKKAARLAANQAAAASESNQPNSDKGRSN
ncbi:hypothetical protein ACFO9Q_08225, partial [Paenibacillus sp. GCM10023252]|uniref:hypothetical protein n=1 Tax=Paenibacillus sp. GCM10023252 TaxID=3252649 RepID=UPI00360E9C4B